MMGKARPAVIARALASSATPPAGRACIRHWLVKTCHFRVHVRSALAWPCAARSFQFSSISFIFKSDWGPDPQHARPLLASQCGSLYPDPFSQPPLFGRRGTDHLP